MKRYYKHDAESEHGFGIVYMEITGEWPTRQVEVYGDGEIWYWGDDSHNRYLADQPFERLDLREEHEVGAAEFERFWQEALRRCPPAS